MMKNRTMIVWGMSLLACNLVVGCSGGSRIEVVQKNISLPGQQHSNNALEIVNAINEGKEDLHGGLARLHTQLKAEKDLFVVKGALEIAQAVTHLKKGNEIENLATIMGAPKKPDGSSPHDLHELATVLKTAEKKTHDDLIKANAPRSYSRNASHQDLALHGDAFLIEYYKIKSQISPIHKSALDSYEFWTYFETRMASLLDEAMRAVWDGEVNLNLRSANIRQSCYRSGFLVRPKLSGEVYKFISEKRRYLQERDVPSNVANAANAILTEYSGLASLHAGSNQEVWFLDNFHLAVHLAKVKGDPANGIPSLDDSAREVYSTYFTLWVDALKNSIDYPRLKRNGVTQAPPRITTREFENYTEVVSSLIAGARASGKDLVHLNSHLSKVQHGVDLLNGILEVHPKNYEFDRQAVCDVSLDPKQSRTLRRYTELLDHRFYGVLAPYWDWMKAVDAVVLSKYLAFNIPKHPLTKMYASRAAFSVGSGEYVQDLTTQPGQKMNKGYVTDNYQVYRNELKSFVSVDSDKGTEIQKAMKDYLRQLTRVEIARFLLDEQNARVKGGDHTPRDLAAFKVELLDEIHDALNMRFQFSMTNVKNEHVAKLALQELFPKSFQNNIAHVGNDCYFNWDYLSKNAITSGIHLNIGPGIYDLTCDLTMVLESAYIHPLAVLYGPGENKYQPKSTAGVFSWDYWAGTVPDPIPAVPGKTVAIHSQSVLNNFEDTLANAEISDTPRIGVPSIDDANSTHHDFTKKIGKIRETHN